MKNGDFLIETTHDAETDYIVKRLIASNRLNLWASTPGEGKSLLSEALGYHIVYDAPFLGMNVKAGSVILIDSENRRDILVNRLKRIKEGLKLDGYSMMGQFDIQHYSGLLLDDKKTWHDILRAIEALHPSLIIFDHLAAFHHQNENKEEQMKMITTAIEALISINKTQAVSLGSFVVVLLSMPSAMQLVR
jgi:RecA-family ATPase